MSAFMCSIQATNSPRSRGRSGSRTRWTTTPSTSSSGGDSSRPRASTCTSRSCWTRLAASLRTWRASPPSISGGYSQDRMSTPNARASSQVAPARQALADQHHAALDQPRAVTRPVARLDPQLHYDVPMGETYRPPRAPPEPDACARPAVAAHTEALATDRHEAPVRAPRQEAEPDGRPATDD